MSRPGWRARVAGLKRDVLTVYFAARDPRLPWPVRALALAIAAYALSPIDLIPDVIPVLGLLDDLVLLPLGIALVVRLTPPAVLEAARARAATANVRPSSVAAVVVIVALWAVALAWLARVAWRAWSA